MRPRARAARLACAALAAATLPAGPPLAAGHATPGRAALTWTVTPSPNTNYRGNQLMDVSCGSASACTAVGFTSSRQGFTKTLVESWNGTTWTIAPSPNRAAYNPLTSVSCTSASACTAVGISYTSHGAPRALVESWDGTTWTIVPSPNPNAPNREADLEGVSCSGLSACMAVGFYSRKFGPPITLAESWNGT